jgi:DNA modification methylase
MLLINEIIQGDCLNVMKGIPDKSIDLVLTDPPYGINLDKWDSGIDINEFTKETNRVIKETGFYVFFGQMPTIIEWINGANKYFKFKDHIVWIKRTCTPSYRLSRGHEEILIYSKNGMKFYKNKGKYEDVRVPGVIFDTASIEGIKRYISSLWRKIKGSEEIIIPGKNNSIYKRYQYSHYRSAEYVNYTNVWSFLPENKKHRYKKELGHPTTKPILLIERLVEMLSLENMLVLDPFLGSGTTVVACKQLNRNYIGIEKDEKYYQLAKRRVNEISQPLLV